MQVREWKIALLPNFATFLQIFFLPKFLDFFLITSQTLSFAHIIHQSALKREFTNFHSIVRYELRLCVLQLELLLVFV